MVDPVRIGARDSNTQHAAERMRDDIGFGYSQMVEQRHGVARQIVEMQLACGFG